MCEINKNAITAMSEDGQVAYVDPKALKRRDLIRGLASGAMFVVLPACATNPETGRSQFTALAPGDAQMAAMALDAWNEQKAKTPISRDPTANARLQRVGQRIAVASGRTNLPWEFVVFDTNEKNAFVLPGGKVGFYRGLMDISDRDDHIATVVGHEVGHVTGRHAAERFSQGIAAQVGLTAAQAGTGGMDPRTRQIALTALGLGAQVGVLLPYSRLQESEADRIGVDYMVRAGYDPRESVRFWERMNQSGGARPPTILSTHPDPARRMADLRAYISAKGYATF
jgi:predicted Zn-dependent protease